MQEIMRRSAVLNAATGNAGYPHEKARVDILARCCLELTGHDREIVGQRDKDDCPGWESEIQDDDGKQEEEQDNQRRRHTVHDIRLQSPENLARLQNCGSDGRNTFFGQDNVCGSGCCWRSTCDCDSNVGPLQSWGIVHTITSHAHERATSLEGFYDAELVFRIDASKSVNILQPGTGKKKKKQSMAGQHRARG
jgi:hypothetical protein